jgi:hypothetical protein
VTDCALGYVPAPGAALGGGGGRLPSVKITCEPPAALSVNVIEPFRGPGALGWNVTLTEQVGPAGPAARDAPVQPSETVL